VTQLSKLGPAQPIWAELGPTRKIKQNYKKIEKYVYAYNVNLLFYSLTPESGIKNIDLIFLFNYIRNKKYVHV
jgi:hypothetical protein